MDRRTRGAWLCIAFLVGLQWDVDAMTRPTSELDRLIQQFLNNSTFMAWQQTSQAVQSEHQVAQFRCPSLRPSPVRPVSVHRLRPGDVRVVGALGDSYTAGKAAGGPGLTSLYFDYRGLSWSAGGDESAATFPSMPNILREYSPFLYGYSEGVGNRASKNARFNVGVGAATSASLAEQVNFLVRRLLNDTNVDFLNDWKVFTIFIGGNNLCHSCKKPSFTPASYIRDLQASLDMLQLLVPRAFINLVELVSVEMARLLPSGAFCETIAQLFCGCVCFPATEEQFRKIRADRAEYQRLTRELVTSGRYDHREDFTVVLQPFYTNAQLARLRGPHGGLDYSFYSADCFHYSRKGQAATGVALWNNMLEPVGHKTDIWNASASILCPSEHFPYLATRKNSRELLLARRKEAALLDSHKRACSASPSEDRSNISKTLVASVFYAISALLAFGFAVSFVLVGGIITKSCPLSSPKGGS